MKLFLTLFCLTLGELPLTNGAVANETYFQSWWNWGASYLTTSSQNDDGAKTNATFLQSLLAWGETAADYWKKTNQLARATGLTAGCERITCAQGEILVRNRTAMHIVPDGCGSYGFILPPQVMIGFTVCCDLHDLCYSKCNSKRSRCDWEMRDCHMDVCRMVLNLFGNESAIVGGCHRMVDILYEAVNNFGCIAFRSAQIDQCYCHKHQYRRSDSGA